MGCVASKIHKDGRVQVCKERKRLMKQLVVNRGEFAEAQLAYLRALKNTGVTLRQFTESESLELEDTSYVQALPPSPPLPLPPSPPPPPPFSPDLRKSTDKQKEDIDREESMSVNEDDCCTPPPPPIVSSSWNIWDPFEVSSLQQQEKSKVEPALEDENWAETKTEFEEEDWEEVNVGSVVSSSLPQQQKQQQQQLPLKLVDDDSSVASWCTKDTTDGVMVNLRNKKTLEGIIKELDDYFLKASAGGKEIAVLMDISQGDTSLRQFSNENKRKRSNSAKVFSALSWSWSSKSLQYPKDAFEVSNSNEPCKPGAHRITLDKLYAAEQKLYKEVKEEEMAKIEHEKKSTLLQKQEEENHDWSKTDKTRFSVEGLETDISRLQHSISGTCSSIVELIDEELYPQLVALTSGLKSLWRTMYECHQVQNHIAQQLSHLTDSQTPDCTTDYHREATAQLESEIVSWLGNFCKLMKSQQEYVRTLFGWIQLTNCLADDNQQNGYSSAVRRLCEHWLLIFDRLPDKIASEAIKSLLTAIQAIMLQQDEEYNLQKKSDKLEKRLEKELFSLAEMEKKVDWNFAAGDMQPDLSPKHPLSIKRAKTEALKKRADSEKLKYLNSVQVTGVMTLNNLKTGLPNVFQALMGFSSASAQAFEAVLSHSMPAVDCDAAESSVSENH
ncbi:protein ALTERED PHOSPHATE STARVATION RESPONSE 1 [Mercurialis annua]|uniref:protein ALTERED PHOSPHATE STARVATION RESPONSE 1 n=1 Tax=Mercurialis annua TaxID=3986 RepID=UPI002160DFAF|nr:protein ALTERED PHOSPHATE STARVATION RESPONSE 1 [Mercurialis annua]XP_050223792.1 protein ALTERED PHOSPHATE STARVATION RESPONSE 1 [Mercurialis annua]XP_050223793.1 protein ALTERED PHOSPHATE STARVATION RESPONSE 1 [Mercurialis annua]